MTGRELKRQFLDKGLRRGGMLLLDSATARALVAQARHQHIPVLGLEGFVVGVDSTRPSPEHIADFSDPGNVNTWDAADRLLAQWARTDLLLDVVLR